MRNFWLEADIDGRKTALSSGPTGKDGGMRITIRQRDKGESVVAFCISCREINGKLVTTVYGNGSLLDFETER